jgi:preprotein translocase subunit SecD
VGLAALILLFAFAIRTYRKRGGWYALFVLLALSGYLLTGLVESTLR